MKGKLLVGLDNKTVRFLEYNDMDCVSLHKCQTFKHLVYLYVYDTRGRVYIEKAYAWGPVKPETIVYLQEDEKRAKAITRSEYETFEVFQNDQNA